MTSALQNRLVGTIVVVALVVIFVPEFLDGEKSTNQQSFVEVPNVDQLVEVKPSKPIDTSIIQSQVERPSRVSDESPLDADESKQDVDGGDSAEPGSSETLSGIGDSKDSEMPVEDQVALGSSKESKPSNEIKPAVKSVNLDDIKIDDTGWVVQLGSFQHEKNVKSLLKTLNDAGYRVYTRPITNSAGIALTKVFIGPELDRKKLEDALPHLLELTNLKGKITPFEVSAN